MAQSQPDLILIPGDFVAHGLMAQTMKIEEIGSVLGALPKAAPTYAVLGNHDHVNHSVEAMVRGLQDASIIPLENASAVVSLRNGACQFQLVGIGDDFWGAAVPVKAFVGVDAEQPVVAMTHSPTLYPGVGKRVDLLIAGHTHGDAAVYFGRAQVGQSLDQGDLPHAWHAGRHAGVQRDWQQHYSATFWGSAWV